MNYQSYSEVFAEFTKCSEVKLSNPIKKEYKMYPVCLSCFSFLLIEYNSNVYIFKPIKVEWHFSFTDTMPLDEERELEREFLYLYLLYFQGLSLKRIIEIENTDIDEEEMGIEFWLEYIFKYKNSDMYEILKFNESIQIKDILYNLLQGKFSYYLAESESQYKLGHLQLNQLTENILELSDEILVELLYVLKIVDIKHIFLEYISLIDRLKKKQSDHEQWKKSDFQDLYGDEIHYNHSVNIYNIRNSISHNLTSRNKHYKDAFENLEKDFQNICIHCIHYLIMLDKYWRDILSK